MRSTYVQPRALSICPHDAQNTGELENGRRVEPLDPSHSQDTVRDSNASLVYFSVCVLCVCGGD